MIENTQTDLLIAGKKERKCISKTKVFIWCRSRHGSRLSKRSLLQKRVKLQTRWKRSWSQRGWETTRERPVGQSVLRSGKLHFWDGENQKQTASIKSRNLSRGFYHMETRPGMWSVRRLRWKRWGNIQEKSDIQKMRGTAIKLINACQHVRQYRSWLCGLHRWIWQLQLHRDVQTAKMHKKGELHPQALDSKSVLNTSNNQCILIIVYVSCFFP